MNISCSKSSLKRIGAKLRHGESLTPEEECCFSEFRLGHRNIIEQFRMRARQHLKKKDHLFASRIKKRQTIICKLQDRFSTMDLTRMQDIAGCRIFFPSIKDLVAFRATFLRLKLRNVKRISEEGQYDYISKPNPVTGYRGIHDVFQEMPTGLKGEIRAKIEVQYRTWVQHAWATALEIWDNYYQHGAKFGREQPDVQQFFLLVSELFWRYLDNGKASPKLDISAKKLFADIRRYDEQLQVLDKFVSIYNSKIRPPARSKVKIVPHKPQSLVLQRSIDVETSKPQRLIVKQTNWNELEENLFKNERTEQGFDFVFVCTDQYARTYNNYLNNPAQFLKYLRRALDLCREDAVGLFGRPDRFYQALDVVR